MMLGILRLSAVLVFFQSSVLQCSVAEEWAFDNAPGIAMEYKVHIDPGKEDCYWQYVHQGATIYISMQVLKGGDGQAGMAVKNHQNVIVHPYAWKASSEYEETAVTGGYYSVCIDNQFSRFAGKLINLYITTFRYDLWEKYSQELEDMEISVTNFTHSIKKVDEYIHNMLQYQSYSRALEGRDYNLLVQNGDYVQFWSIAQCITIVVATILQIYSLRKFFDTSPKTKTGARA